MDRYFDMDNIGNSALKASMDEYCIAPPKSFAEACRIGFKHGVYFLQYLREYPDLDGDAVKDMVTGRVNFHDDLFMSAYWASFYTFLEAYPDSETQGIWEYYQEMVVKYDLLPNQNKAEH